MCAALGRPSETRVMEVGNAAHIGVVQDSMSLTNQLPEEREPGADEELSSREERNSTEEISSTSEHSHVHPVEPSPSLRRRRHHPHPRDPHPLDRDLTAPSKHQPARFARKRPYTPPRRPRHVISPTHLLDAIVSPLRLRGEPAADACRWRGDRREPLHDASLGCLPYACAFGSSPGYRSFSPFLLPYAPGDACASAAFPGNVGSAVDHVCCLLL